MMAGGAPVSGGDPLAEQVRGELEAVLLRVVTAGRVAEVMWRLLLNGQRVHRRWPANVDREQGSSLVQPAWHGARDAIAATVHEQTPWVYHAAVRAACPVDDPDLAAVVLAELAGMHLRTGNAADCRRLVELAGAGEDLGERARDMLATVRAWMAEYELRQANIDLGHEGNSGADIR
jgi:hypothetical protein